MKNSKSAQALKPFVYIDSSEEEDYHHNHRGNRRGLEWGQGEIIRECKAERLGLDGQKEYRDQLKAIIRSEMEKIEHGRAVVVPPNDHQMMENFRMRKEKYAYFIEQMQIDEKYSAKISSRVHKLKQTNLKKQKVLQKKRAQQQRQEEENLLRKHVIEKRSNQEKVVKGVKKTVHELGVERKAELTKKVKTQIEAERVKTSHRVHDMKRQQRDELMELREEYEALRRENRMNRLDQEKALRDMKKDLGAQRRQLEERLLIKKDFVV